jgi:hypothetical protein
MLRDYTNLYCGAGSRATALRLVPMSDRSVAR